MKAGTLRTLATPSIPPTFSSRDRFSWPKGAGLP